MTFAKIYRENISRRVSRACLKKKKKKKRNTIKYEGAFSFMLRFLRRRFSVGKLYVPSAWMNQGNTMTLFIIDRPEIRAGVSLFALPHYRHE